MLKQGSSLYCGFSQSNCRQSCVKIQFCYKTVNREENGTLIKVMHPSNKKRQ